MVFIWPTCCPRCCSKWLSKAGPTPKMLLNHQWNPNHLNRNLSRNGIIMSESETEEAQEWIYGQVISYSGGSFLKWICASLGHVWWNSMIGNLPRAMLLFSTNLLFSKRFTSRFLFREFQSESENCHDFQTTKPPGLASQLQVEDRWVVCRPGFFGSFCEWGRGAPWHLPRTLTADPGQRCLSHRIKGTGPLRP